MNVESQGQLMITRRTLFRMESKDLGLGHANVIVSSGSARARNPGGLGTGKCFPPPPAPLRLIRTGPRVAVGHNAHFVAVVVLPCLGRVRRRRCRDGPRRLKRVVQHVHFHADRCQGRDHLGGPLHAIPDSEVSHCPCEYFRPINSPMRLSHVILCPRYLGNLHRSSGILQLSVYVHLHVAYG